MKCLICENNIKFNILNLTNDFRNEICTICLNKLEVINLRKSKKMEINGKEVECELLMLFSYNEFTKNYMYYLKEKGDISLIRIFKPYLQDLYEENKDYVFIPIKSSEKTYKKRQFYPNEEFLKQIKGIQIKEGPTRLDDIKQGKLSIKERLKNNQKYNEVRIEEEKIIIFDDVIVTGHTLQRYIQSINFVRLKKLKIIILLKSKKVKL